MVLIVKSVKIALSVLVCSGLVFVLGLQPAQAATVVTYDLTAGTEAGAGDGNHYDFVAAGLPTLQAWAFSDNDNNLSTLNSAQVLTPAGGLGVCNASEDIFFIFFNLDCAVWLGARQASDNNGERDWLLLYLPDEYTNQWLSVEIASAGGQDMDISYWVGDLASPGLLNGANYSGLGSRVDVDDPANGAGPLTLDLNNASGNALLIGASYTNVDGLEDRIVISSVTTLVPIPAAVWLFASAIGLLLTTRRK